ncbi:MAG: phage tail protein [Chloroflexi bacterium]|nr:phage tail protein [Chloroflexota bacterium]
MAGGLPNLPSDALASYLFAIEIDSIEIAQFTEISGLVSEIDVIELKENTRDGKLVIHKSPGAMKPPPITHNRAKNTSKAHGGWRHAMLQGKVSESRKNGSVILKSYDGTEVARYNFTNAWVSKVSTGTLKAGANEVLMEEASLVCESFTRA